MTHISIVSPVYKAQECVLELYKRLTASIQQISNDYEIILVEDRGGDGSWDIIKDICSKDKHVVGIQLSTNTGQHVAITAGLEASRGDWVVIMDCDLQDPPESIPVLYAKALEGYDIVEAKFTNRNKFERLKSVIFWKILSALSGTHFDSEVGNFRIISRKVAAGFCRYQERLRLLGGIISLMGFKKTQIHVNRDERFAGESCYTIRKLLSSASDIIVAYSDMPLKISIYLGFSISIFTALVGIVILALWASGFTSYSGWTSIMLSIYFIGGIIIANLGIVGLYLSRTFTETKRRPLYIIDNDTRKAEVLATGNAWQSIIKEEYILVD